MQLGPTSTRNILRLGFTVILGLMFLVASISLTMLHNGSARTKALVLQNYSKSELIHEMRVAGRERIINLQNMLVLEDPFRQDEEWMRLNQRGADFAAARLQIMELDLTPEERRLLDEQSELTTVVGQLHLDIASLIMEGDKEAAHTLLEAEAIPRQHHAFALFAELLALQSRAGMETLRQAEAEYRQSVITTLLLMLGITGFSLLIARYLVRRTTETEARLNAANEYAHVTLHSIGDGLITTNHLGLVEQMNPEAERLTGWRADEARHIPVDKIFMAHQEAADSESDNPVQRCLRLNHAVTSSTDVMLKHLRGNSFAIEYTVAPIFDERHDRITGTILVFRDVTELRIISNELSYQAKHDMLTGLMNRHEFEQHLEKVISGTHHGNTHPYWLCYLDLDQFKLINDTCGHLAGDELLKQVSRTMQSLLRELDLLARMGGDEFAILLNRCTDKDAMGIMERIRLALDTLRFSWGQRSFSISGSFGLVPITGDYNTLYEVLSTADAACYIAKEEGSNRIHLYQGENDPAALHTGEMHWVQRIKEALEQDRLVLYHQPIESLQNRHCKAHSEILVRMLDEDGGLVPPMSFIPAAERYRLMADIDRWVVRKTLDALHLHMRSAAPGDCIIAINLSGQSLCDDEFLSFVLDAFERHDVNPQHICFEITETCAIANLNRAIHFIDALRDRGCLFALDDFGSGLSSFGYLKNLPVDFIKIDGSFVRDIGHDPMVLAMVNAINQIGHAAGMRTVAEYVETTAIRERLQALGVDYAQGYGVARPEPLRELVARLPHPLPVTPRRNHVPLK